MIREYLFTPVAAIREMHPGAAIIRRAGERTLVFDTAADAYLHETAQLVTEGTVQ